LGHFFKLKNCQRFTIAHSYGENSPNLVTLIAFPLHLIEKTTWHQGDQIDYYGQLFENY
jgi:hypothetical protein